ncbi:MAG TPA: farnesyl diphosphate synthase [Lachnospiraceae bacterium]|nr:farnesyl diphosphate synthase [Lachnospiraceae bacterium]
MNFKEELLQKVKNIELLIEEYLPEESGYQKTVIEAMNYSMRVGGKRLRPILMVETFQMLGGTGKIVEPFMVALEMIHTYSLVHDDLPAMDNDEYRRGNKTTHVVYGEAMAILAGDGLLNLAFETALKAYDINENHENIGKALRVLAQKAGIYGMIGGQTADVEAEKRDITLTEDQILFIHENKTAALIQSAMMIGALLAGAKDDVVKKIEKIAYNIGIAFQIRDDILDVTSSLEVLGKPIGSDIKNNKMTYVALKGLEYSKIKVEEVSKEALELFHCLEGKGDFLNALILDLVQREK